MGASCFISSYEKVTRVAFFTAGSGTWTCPAGVTSITVECWGSGAGGGSATSRITPGQWYGGGAGSGAYAKKTMSVTPGTEYAYTVGAGGASDTDGAATSFNGTSCIAAGGKKGKSSQPSPEVIYAAGGLGGAAADSSGDIVHSGGAGSSGRTYTAGSVYYAGGGSGGSGGPVADGHAANREVGGAPFTMLDTTIRLIDFYSLVSTHPYDPQPLYAAGAGVSGPIVTSGSRSNGISPQLISTATPGVGGSGAINTGTGGYTNTGGKGLDGFILISYVL